MDEKQTTQPSAQPDFASRYILSRLFRKAEEVLDQMQASQKQEADAMQARAEKAEARVQELDTENKRLLGELKAAKEPPAAPLQDTSGARPDPQP